MRLPDIRQPRRTVVIGAGLGVLATVIAACSGSSTKSDAGSSAAPTTGAGDTASSGASEAPGAAIAKTADVPVGSGVIVGDTVVTQPTAGTFSGFSAACPHRGCDVSKVTDGKIVCPCHGSEFNLDGTVAKGPATKPLEAKAVTVQGDSIVAG